MKKLSIDGLVFLVKNSEKISESSQSVYIEEGKFSIEISSAIEAEQVYFLLHAKEACFLYGLQAFDAEENELKLECFSGKKAESFFYLDKEADLSCTFTAGKKIQGDIQIRGYLLPLFEAHFFYELLEVARIKKKYARLEKQYKQAITELYQVSNDKRELETAYDAVLHSFFWRLTKPLRSTSTAIKKLLQATPVTNWLLRILLCIREKGIRFTIQKIFRRICRKDAAEKQAKILPYRVCKAIYKQQKKAVFSSPYSYDIYLYIKEENSIEEIEACIFSVERQSYELWSLHLVVPQSISSKKEIEELVRITEKNTKINWILGWSEGETAAINWMARQSRGDYRIIMQAKDLLHPSALFECQKILEEEKASLLYTDEASFENNPETPFDFHFKPNYAPITLTGHNYINHMVVIEKALWEKAGMLNEVLEEESHYDWLWHLLEQQPKVVHIAKALYYNREKKGFSMPEEQSMKMQQALQSHLERIDIPAKVSALSHAGTFKVDYAIQKDPLVSILIPNKDYVSDLSNCIQSIFEKSTYRNFEIIIIENNSTKQETFEYYEEIQKEYEQIRVVYWKGIFNYSGINNYGAEFAKGDYFILLNNDVEIITPSWIEELLMFAQMPKAGAVGAMLYYPDDTVQHAGVTIGVQGIGGHAHKDFKRGDEGYHHRMLIAQNLSGVTAACMMLPKKVFEKVGGLDERFEVAFNDVDLCLKILKEGYDVIFTPFAELYHFESKSRGTDETPVKRKRFVREVMLFTQEWKSFLDQGDPYYNPNLTLEANDFSYKK